MFSPRNQNVPNDKLSNDKNKIAKKETYMKKNKLFAAVCSAAVTLSLAVCSVPASALSREDFSPQSLEAIDSVSSLDELLRLADGFVAPLALAKGPKQLCYLVSFEAEVSNVKKLSGNLTYPSNINVAECAPSQTLIENSNCYECHPETDRLKDCLMTGDIMLSHNKEKYLCDVCKAEAYQRASSQW